MVSTIPTIETGKNNVFGDVSKNTAPNNYWLVSNQNSVPNKKKEITISANLGGKNIELPLMTPDEARKTHNTEIIGLSIAGATIFTAAALFLLLKGGPKGVTKNFTKLRNYFESKIQKSRLDNTDNPKVNKVYAFMVKQIDFCLNKFEAVNNWHSFKDLVFKNFMYNKYTGSVTGKMHAGITHMFERIGRQTVVNSYKATKKKLISTLGSSMGEESKILLNRKPGEMVEINGRTQTVEQWREELVAMNKDISDIYERHFSERPLFGRFFRAKHTASDLYEAFQKKGIKSLFWSRKTLNSFIAESAIAEEKLGMQNAVKGFRREISYSKEDLLKDTEDLIMEMTRSVKYNDFNSLAKLREINLNIKRLFKTADSKEYETLRADIFKKIDSLEFDIINPSKNKEISSQSSKELLENILELRTMLKDFRQGKIEDMLEIYKKLLPENEYLKIEKSYKETIKSLDKSINIETEDFISKERDLSLGGAPTDIVNILGAFAVLGYNLGKTDNKQERQSVLLKYGIPVIAGIGTMVYCSAKLFAGTKGLLFGAISTAVVGKIGSWSDNLLKKHNEQKKQYSDSYVSTK